MSSDLSRDSQRDGDRREHRYIYVSSAPFETLKKAVNTGWYFNASDFIIDAIKVSFNKLEPNLFGAAKR
ncbi:MAG TPA: hypothetical protein VFD60_07765 [Nitrososphaeraceae archaeon]|nr:hypothetical protein [Nitrososphaeraceae archaeon]